MSIYGSGPYGAGLYGWTETVQGAGGGITVDYSLYRATLDNQVVEDITRWFTGGGTDLNHDRAIRSQATFEVSDAAKIDPYTDYLAVFLYREYDDGSEPKVDQLGLFTVGVPRGERTAERADGLYVGHDLTEVLARRAFITTQNFAVGSNYVQCVIAILAAAGIFRSSIPVTDKVLATPRTFAVGFTYLEAANTLLSEIGYYHLGVTPDGRLTSGPTRDIRYVSPYRRITDRDLMGPVVPQVTDTTVANVVIVVKENLSEAPLTAVRRNDDPTSPTSTVNLGTITRVERRADLADQAAVDALADRLLSEGRTFYQTARLTLLPDPEVLVPHQVIDLDLSGRLSIFNGRWWVRTADVPFDTGPTALEINRVTDAIQGVLL